MKQKPLVLGISLILVGVIGLLGFVFFQPGVNSIDDVLGISERYLNSLNIPDLVIEEIMEFEQNFYVLYSEESTGIGAFEMLIDKDTGQIFPEYGPNMMWNTKYGHGGMMGGWNQLPSNESQITENAALILAQTFLDDVYPGTLADDPHLFHGYYTLHVIKNGAIYGMLSVNSFDGNVWGKLGLEVRKKI
jgi:hypothetical protein